MAAPPSAGPAYRAFAALVVTQAISAFNQNLVRAAVVTSIAFGDLRLGGLSAEQLTGLSTIAIVAPLCLLSLPAGRLADHWPKRDVIIALKAVEIGVCALAACGLVFGNMGALLAALVLAGLEASLFGPAKYGIVAELVGHQQLSRANALVGGTLLLAILGGFILGNLMVGGQTGRAGLAVLLMTLAVIGFATSRLLPHRPAAVTGSRLSLAGMGEDVRSFVSHVAADRPTLAAMCGNTWFWFQGALNTTLFPLYVSRLGESRLWVAILLVVCTLSAALGAFVSYRLVRGERLRQGLRYAVVALTAAPGLDLLRLGLTDGIDMTRVAVDFAAMSLATGLFWAPLNAVVQARADDTFRARRLGANYTLHGLALVSSGASIALLPSLGVSVPLMFFGNAVATALVAFFTLPSTRSLAAHPAGGVAVPETP